MKKAKAEFIHNKLLTALSTENRGTLTTRDDTELFFRVESVTDGRVSLVFVGGGVVDGNSIKEQTVLVAISDDNPVLHESNGDYLVDLEISDDLILRDIVDVEYHPAFEDESDDELDDESDEDWEHATIRHVINTPELRDLARTMADTDRVLSGQSPRPPTPPPIVWIIFFGGTLILILLTVYGYID